MNSIEQARLNPLYAAMLRALQLQGKAEKTVEAYARAVRRSADFFERCPDDLTAEELQTYFAALLKSHSWSTVKLDRCGLQFFYRYVLKRPWDWTEIVKPPRPQRLPDVLTREETLRLLGTVRKLRYRVFFTTLYSTGLRLSEGLALEVGDIDAQRLRIHVRGGKGDKDRYVPITDTLLHMLRRWWATHRHPRLLFPNPTGGPERMRQAATPMDRGGVQAAMQRGGGRCPHPPAHQRPQPAPLLLDPYAGTGGGSARAADHPRPRPPGDHRPLRPSDRGHRRPGARAPRPSAGVLRPALEGRRMIRLAELIKTFLPDLEQKYGSRLLPSHRQALTAIEQCRTQALGTAAIHCHDCDSHEVFPLSCGHRFCPQCQHEAGETWLERQRAKLLPVDYYLITFTLPATLRALVYDHQREAYDLLIRLAWQTLAAFGLRDKALHGDLGATVVLHTHSRALDFHPHVHVVLPAGAIDPATRHWNRKTGQVPLPPQGPGQGLPGQVVRRDEGTRLGRPGRPAGTVGGRLQAGRQR